MRKRELLSLIGTLSHACKVVRSGRAFLRRLITLSTGVKRLDHFIRLSKCARSDIEWWYTYSKGWNGVSMMSLVNKTNPEVSLTTDALGSWGCGGFSNTQWFSLKWVASAMSLHITVKELLPITIAAGLWGPHWRGQSVQVWCDNEAVVTIINQNTSKDLEAMHLMRCLAFIMAKCEFFLFASHIKGQHNKIADALSRDNVQNFVSTGTTSSHGYSVSTTGFVDSRETRLVVNQLDRVVEFYFSHGIAASTQRTYLSAKHRYLQFCCTNKLDPLPASEHRLCQFVAALALEGLSHSTLKGYLSGVRHLHLENHYKNPNISTMARLEQVLKGIKSLQTKTKGNSHPRLSMTPELLVISKD